jgi:hypothetical protein
MSIRPFVLPVYGAKTHSAPYQGSIPPRTESCAGSIMRPCNRVASLRLLLRCRSLSRSCQVFMSLGWAGNPSPARSTVDAAPLEKVSPIRDYRLLHSIEVRNLQDERLQSIQDLGIDLDNGQIIEVLVEINQGLFTRGKTVAVPPHGPHVQRHAGWPAPRRQPAGLRLRTRIYLHIIRIGNLQPLLSASLRRPTPQSPFRRAPAHVTSTSPDASGGYPRGRHRRRKRGGRHPQ